VTQSAAGTGANLDDVVTELRGLRKDVRDLGDRVSTVEGRASAAVDKAVQAYERSNEAMRASEEVRVNAAATQAAMLRHAESVKASSEAMVAANAAQTPILDALTTWAKDTNKAVGDVKRYAPLVISVMVALGGALGAVVHAFMLAR
jgi:cell division septum initiation protein DivIVA